MLVGNDVVDLQDPETRPEAIHVRFDARAFTHEERTVLGASATAHALRWTLWAAKESAYKAAKKIDSRVRFLPRNFRVRQMDEGRALVLHEMGSFDVWLEATDEWVHAVATQHDLPVPSRLFSTGVGSVEAAGGDPSRRVRELACEAVGSRLNLPPAQVHIEADGSRVPVAFLGHRRLPVDLSLSHHGRFVAWACGAHAVGPIRTELLPEVPATERSA